MKTIWAIIFCLLALTPLSAMADRDVMVIDYVIDGDTFSSNGTHIRLWGIDAPEKGQRYYFASAAKLEKLLYSAPVTCELKDIDKYGRSVMKCFSGDKDISGELARFGLAEDFTFFSKGYYKKKEETAKAEEIGMWEKQ